MLVTHTGTRSSAQTCKLLKIKKDYNVTQLARANWVRPENLQLAELHEIYSSFIELLYCRCYKPFVKMN